MPFHYLILIHVLVDLRATHSFISGDFLGKARVETGPVDYSVIMSLPIGDSLVADQVYVESKVIISGREFEADLIVLNIHDFDVILGMDWLSKHRATVDCYRKEVKLSKAWEPDVIFYEVRKILLTILISVIRANKMLQKAY